MKDSSARRNILHQFREAARANPYRSQIKPKGTPKCPSCKAVSIRGRWVSPSQVQALNPTVLVTGELKCPACRQTEDHFALGVVEVSGEKWQKKRELISNTIKNTEAVVRHRNDQERIVWIDEAENYLKVYVTLPELARQIGNILENSFQGKVQYEHSTQEPFTRVIWQSDLPHGKHSPGRRLSVKKRIRGDSKAEDIAHKSKAFRKRSKR